LDGIINILKPPAMTSHDVIYWVRKNLNINKAGHTGTLDPGAAGVLPVCLGKGTKIIPYIDENRKTYRAKIVFGITTDTQDKYGQVLKKIVPNFSLLDFNNTLKGFIGKIQQKPSIYSAIRVKGKRLYDYARQNEKVEIPTREVFIHNIRVIQHNIPHYAFIEVECSKGTYIRTLCSDIGENLQCGAHLGFLLRTTSGDFNISSSISLEELENKYKNHEIKEILLPLDYPLKNYTKIKIKESARNSLINGNPIYPKGIISDIETLDKDKIVPAYINNKLIAMGRIQYDKDGNRYYYKPLRVLL